ncbi:MAG TPA: hypothetical protein VI603_09025 [Saprospiraceae bacterium]|nr:hypothetical protein [Saprospiraceae bacterium]
MQQANCIACIGILFIAGFYATVHGQSKRVFLEERLAGKQSLTEIMKEIDDFYLALPEEERNGASGLPKYKHLKRREWYLSGRLGPHGEFVDVDSLNSVARHRQKVSGAIPGQRAPSNWMSVGPVSSEGNLARVDRLAFHPTDSDIIYAGTPAGGLWKTTDGGDTWQPLTDDLESLAISGIIVSYADPNTLYILTGDGDASGGGFTFDFGYVRKSAGVYKSTDGGVNWTQLDLPILGDYYGYRLAQNPDNADELYAATSEGLYRTLDGGNIWGLSLVGNFFDVEYNPGNAAIAYASADAVIWRTTNYGVTWGSVIFPLNQGLCQYGRIELAVSPDSVNVVYALSGPVQGAGQFCGLFRSSDAGNSFTRVANTPNILGRAVNGTDSVDQSFYDLAIAVHPDDADKLYTGGINVWKSSNGGMTLAQTSIWFPTGDPQYVHADIHDLKFNPLDNTLYAATDGGIWTTTNGGANWTDISDGIVATQFYHMTGRPGYYDDLYAGAQDNGVKYRPGNGYVYTQVNGGDGFSVAHSPSTTQRFFSTLNQLVVRHTMNNGNFNGSDITPFLDATTFFKNVIAHPTSDSIVLVGSTDIWKTSNALDGSPAWTNKGASGSWAMANCPSNPSRFYAAGGDDYANGSGAVFRSDNTGETWTNIAGTGFPSSFTKITDVDVSPVFSGIVCATFGGFTDGVKVARSLNAGTSWTNISYNLPNVPVNCVKFDDALNIYAGTDIGVYFLANGTSTWQFTSVDQPNVPVTDLLIYPEENLIYAATFGRGIWSADLNSPCPQNLAINMAQSGNQTYEASGQLSATSVINASANVQMKAGCVLLQTGFLSTAAATFRAFSASCTELFEPQN